MDTHFKNANTTMTNTTSIEHTPDTLEKHKQKQALWRRIEAMARLDEMDKGGGVLIKDVGRKQYGVDDITYTIYLDARTDEIIKMPKKQ